MIRLFLPGLVALTLQTSAIAQAPKVIIAEGEQFRPRDDKGWKVTHQNDSYASHTYGGMWVTHGGLLGAPADSIGSVAVQVIDVPAAGEYRVWSKYQAPPYFNYLHRIEIVQNNKTVYSHDYGKKGTPRLWSFSGESDELWWPWGVDHDAAEAPKTMVKLAAGPAELRLITINNEKPAGDRMIDFVVLTTNPADDYRGFKPNAVGTPFANEAFDATKLYLRFRHSARGAAQLTINRAGHFQPQYGGATMKLPDTPVGSGQWSSWVNIGPFCRLVHDEGITIILPGAGPLEVQVARDAAGKDVVGDVKVTSGEAIVIPIDITWRTGARVKASREHALEIIEKSKKWRHANSGKKPKEILYYGSFGGEEEWVHNLKHTLGYNTQLPAKYPNSQWQGVHQHLDSAAAIEKFAKEVKNRETLRFVSFGDEISLGEINYADPKNQQKFRDWLRAKKVTAQDLGVAPEIAIPTKAGNARLVWYSNLFNEEERFADFRARTELVKKLLGPNVLAGANYSPHHLALCYGPIFQWIDIFKHNGMSMFWGEDYIFSVPELPQILSWMFAEMRCAVKYNNQPIHLYVMPHAPGQTPENLRRNMVMSVGFGARHIDSFWVAPEERFTENYVAWSYHDTFRVIHESIFDSAEAEQLQAGGKLRPAKVAVVAGKATDFNESRLMIDKSKDPFTKACKNAPAQLNQIICRKDQQMLYLALVQAGHAVDVLTEDDIVDRDELKKYEVVYFAGEWIDNRAVAKLDAWVQSGGILYATGGIGHLNQFGEAEPAMMKLLGLRSATTKKDAIIIRTLLELPLFPAMDSITFDGKKIDAIGMKQTLTPDTAKVLGRWSDGSAAVTFHDHGKGTAFAVGTLAGNSYMKTALRVQPWPRGGRKQVYNPVDFDAAATKLVRLGIDAKPVEKAVESSEPLVEAIVMDHPKGTLVTLVNWTNRPVKGLRLSVKTPFKPSKVHTVSGQKELSFKNDAGTTSITLDLEEADYLLLLK
jgi:hypothetical protein